MILARRHLLRLGGAASVLGGASGVGVAQAQPGPRTAPSTKKVAFSGNGMKDRFVAASALGLSTLIAVSAQAQTPAQTAPAYDWTGFYIGFNGGGASSHECLNITSVASVPVHPNSEGCHDATGGLVGGHIGYRWQVTNWVFGIEAQAIGPI